MFDTQTESNTEAAALSAVLAVSGGKMMLSLLDCEKVLGLTRETLCAMRGFPMRTVGKRNIVPAPALVKWMMR